jgi:hypothetical protein
MCVMKANAKLGGDNNVAIFNIVAKSGPTMVVHADYHESRGTTNRTLYFFEGRSTKGVRGMVMVCKAPALGESVDEL